MKEYDSQTMLFHMNGMYEQSLLDKGSTHAAEKRMRNLDEERRRAAEIEMEKMEELRRLVQTGQASLAQQEIFLKRERDWAEKVSGVSLEKLLLGQPNDLMVTECPRCKAFHQEGFTVCYSDTVDIATAQQAKEAAKEAEAAAVAAEEEEEILIQ